jgi:hypothetical protein
MAFQPQVAIDGVKSHPSIDVFDRVQNVLRGLDRFDARKPPAIQPFADESRTFGYMSDNRALDFVVGPREEFVRRLQGSKS